MVSYVKGPRTTAYCAPFDLLCPCIGYSLLIFDENSGAILLRKSYLQFYYKDPLHQLNRLASDREEFRAEHLQTFPLL